MGGSVWRNMERSDEEAREVVVEPLTPVSEPESSESLSHSFVVKVWIEETAAEAGMTMWRGHITHVGTRTRRYIQELDEVSMFIAPYLQALGVETKNETAPSRKTQEEES